ncbi:hypothetical protein [Desulfosporosinus metallidurans]|uniref:Uncharacterized protein n=1 Tax=Desulfosporosinus metallidurans TaxID=1888891 RepID=A0A1Q8QPL4_9FIRM|nr:hypothetical protein [Desulfosporosinus metallidurans]OLN29291.1 hypothetical protein DSOL_3628 [Desulfosporosinus metallidurans]
MIHAWLGRNWDEVKLEIEQMGKPYTFQVAHPHGKMEPWGSCRVVRVRELDDKVDLVLAHEKFSPKQPLTP